MFEDEIQEWSETDAYKGLRIMWRVFMLAFIVMPICIMLLCVL